MLGHLGHLGSGNISLKTPVCNQVTTLRQSDGSGFTPLNYSVDTSVTFDTDWVNGEASKCH